MAGYVIRTSIMYIHVTTDLLICFLGGKKCPSCKQRIYHERWKITPKLAEERWAHHEAKKRELSEVVDFLGDCL